MRAHASPALALAPLLVCLALLQLGCQSDLTAQANVTTLDEPYFRCRVQPVLTETCSAFACHGDPNRYFRVYARNRLRLGGSEAERNAFMRAEERAYNFASASGFVDSIEPDDSLLLRKPLEERSGGYYHGGATLFGKGNVFSSWDDSEFSVLSAWVHGKTEDPTCIELGSDL